MAEIPFSLKNLKEFQKSADDIQIRTAAPQNQQAERTDFAIHIDDGSKSTFNQNKSPTPITISLRGTQIPP
jgi:hypothetical protein